MSKPEVRKDVTLIRSPDGRLYAILDDEAPLQLEQKGELVDIMRVAADELSKIVEEQYMKERGCTTHLHAVFPEIGVVPKR